MSEFSNFSTDPDVIGPNYVIKIGKYSGRTALDIFNIDKNYCSWILDQKNYNFKAI